MLESFREREGLPWPQIYEGQQRQCPLTLLYNGHALPTYYLIDQDGIIRYNEDARKEGIKLKAIVEEVLTS